MNIYDENIMAKLGIVPEINSLDYALEVHEIFINYRCKIIKNMGIGLIPHYRSEQCFGWDIIPSIFRGRGSAYSGTQAKNAEKSAANQFCCEITGKFGAAVLRFSNGSFGKEWDLSFQARHAGIKTTLVDWTGLIYKSIYFAVEQSTDHDIEKSDAQLWVYMTPENDMLNDEAHDRFYEKDPRSLQSGKMVNASVYLDKLDERIFESRIHSQFGRFYFSPEDVCDQPFNKRSDIVDNLFRFKIPANCKASIREDLNRRGLNKDSVYGKENLMVERIVSDINRNF